LLTDIQKQQQADIATELGDFLEASSAQKFSRVVTEDESWFFLDNP
jgi:hypothetical protein